MSHSHTTPTPTSPEDMARQRRALRLMIITLIPIAVWTLGALIIMWPGDVKPHISENLGQYSVPGLTVQTGRITQVGAINCDGVPGSSNAPGAEHDTCGRASVELLDGPEIGQTVDDITLKATDFESGVSEGQQVKLFRIPMEGMEPQYQFSEFERGVPLLLFTLLFIGAVVAVARWRGLMAIVGLGWAFFVMVYFMFPALVTGANPVMVGLVGGSAIMFVVLYAAHGFSARTTTALLGTLFGLITAAILGWIATKWAHLTGVASEDDMILAAAAPDLNMTSIVICGIMLAGLGVLNDVTITQASAVWELAADNPDGKHIFSRAMRIGRDHIASTVYTIAFAIAGATLGTLVLLSIYQRPLLEVLQTEQFSQEIVRTLIGSVGLVAAVPLTTAIGVAVVSASKKSRGEISMAADGQATSAPGDELIDKSRYDH
ncbi:YibE/F family protein [Granulicoccus sp. GXG6511]|uniref:YibE/F family protein n=1 Tax=Granulicoccus sp. GXG6511 TaxID=3381351 RepID=UPI003D7E8DD0